MNQIKTLVVACTLGAALLVGGNARADVTFTYDWSPSLSSISGDNGLNAINFSNQGPVNVTTSQAVGNASSISVANGSSDTFGAKGPASFNLAVKLTDGTASDTLTFAGTLTGNIVNGVPLSMNGTFANPMQTVTLNNDTFTVKMTGFVPPNSYSAGGTNKPGGFGFEIDAVAGSGGGTQPPPNDVPEPSTLVLSFLGLAGAGMGAWKKRQQARA